MLIICSVYRIDSVRGRVTSGTQTVGENWETLQKPQTVRLEMKARWSDLLKVIKWVIGRVPVKL